MKKLFGILILGVFFITNIIADDIVKLSKKEIKELSDKLTIFQNNPNLKIKKVFDRKKDGIYHLQAIVRAARGENMIEGFVDKKTYHLFIGQGYTKNGKKIQYPDLAEDINSGVAFSYGKGEKSIYLVTDPQCPYCKKLEEQLGDKLVQNYKVNFVIFPLSFHKEATPMLQWVLRGKSMEDKYSRLKDIVLAKDFAWKEIFPKKSVKENLDKYFKVLNGTDKNWKLFFKDEAELKRLREYLKRSDIAFKALNARGTPSIFDASFNQVDPNRL